MPNPALTATNSGHFDANNVPSITGVIGTLGTADVKGTAATLPFSVDSTTGAAYVYLITTLDSTNDSVAIGGGTINAGTFTSTGTNVNIVTGTQQTLGTVGVLNNGTLALVTRVENVGTLEVGSVVVTSLPSSGTLLNLASGTLAAVTAVTTVTTVSNLTQGTVRISLGTITTGSLTTVASLLSGSVNLLTGTVTSVSNLAAGTITALAAGTITAGTITQSGFTYSHFSAAGTTTLKSGTGVLHSFVINQKSVGGVGTLFESAGTSSTVIAAIDTTLSTTSFLYDVNFGSLTFAWAGNTGGDITIGWR